MKDDMLTIAAFDNPLFAHLAKSKLESEGITCFLADENLVAVNMLYSTAVGNVKLQVREEDVAKAKEILNSDESGSDYYNDEIITENKQDTQVTCPQCGSNYVNDERFHRRYPWLSIILIGIPIILSSRKWQCGDCQNAWSEKVPISLSILRIILILIIALIISMALINTMFHVFF